MVKNNQIALEYINANQFAITSPVSGSLVCRDGTQSLIVRSPNAVSEPALINLKKVDTKEENQADFDLSEDGTDTYGKLQVRAAAGALTFEADITTAEPIWLMEWKITGLLAKEIIVPALGGQALSERMPEGTTISYKYPFWLNAQFVIGYSKEGGFIIRSKDESPDLKLIRVTRENNSWTISYGFEVPGTKSDRHTIHAEWRIETYRGSWKNAVDNHRQWLENRFELVPKEQHPHYPSWADDINCVLEIWGARRDAREPHHTFEQMMDRLVEWKKFHDPTKTLLYLPGFAEKGIDSHAPDYNPSPQCGGAAKFRKLTEMARQMGFKVMIHTNVLAMTFTHPRYNEFKDKQVIDVFGRRQNWGLDMDGDWLAEPYFAYINPGYPEWTDLMEKTIGDLVKKYKIDAVFLDQTLLAFNVSEGPDFVEGMRNHIKRLQKKFPAILFAGEGLHEQNVGCLPMAQIHGLDSIREVHALDGRTEWRKVHPVSTYLFGRYTKYTPHLLTKHPSDPIFDFQEKSYEILGVLPAMVLYHAGQRLDTSGLRKMLERAVRLSQ